MSLKLSIGLSRKVGEAGYGSRGATVGLELEAEASLVHRPEEFNDQLAHLFALARESVDRELAKSPSTGNGALQNGTSPRQPRPLRAATPNQLRAILAIASEQSLDLAAELRNHLGIERVEDLSLPEASRLIDALKSTARDKELASANDAHSLEHEG